MTKREAKRLVCAACADLLDPAVHPNEFLYRVKGRDRPESDQQRLVEAMLDLVNELDHRGGGGDR